METSWQRRHPLNYLLLPLSGLFCAVVAFRRRLYRWGWLKSQRIDCPVIIVGNITVGGTGKTPLIIWLAQKLTEWGYKPGIITRGYGGKSQVWPCEVTTGATPQQVGDEAILLKRHGECPVFAGPQRPLVAQQLLSNYPCDVILSDDGMQHYALQRDLEIAVVDGERRFGNGYCLPAGPLRETRRRLQQVDLVIINGNPAEGEHGMSVVGDMACPVAGGACKPLTDFVPTSIDAVAGIGHPERFFRMLESAGLTVDRHPFADHHGFTADDLAPFEQKAVLMTEKDAVKCEQFAQPNHWYVPATASVATAFEHQLKTKVKRLLDG
ncbi:MAG: tetraacyldisaccharide 4'-kinase [Candidatus Thiodiazotropha sp. (ex Ctena orbiculata)]|nr:tetraacyldisaccharide 4'-kinase [Candidatus Thiodiazotropha taylori]